MKILGKWLPLLSFRGSADYWRKRYRYGGDSGAGSGGESAAYKAGVLNQFVADHAIESVIELGCGDGRQLALAQYPSYLGFDISHEAVALCREKFSWDQSKEFLLADDFQSHSADVAISLDVIFHLVEDCVYRDYMNRLFSSANKYVVIYSTIEESRGRTLRHVRHRNVADDVTHWFPGFMRMSDYEAGFPLPASGWDSGARFLLYVRVSAQ